MAGSEPAALPLSVGRLCSGCAWNTSVGWETHGRLFQMRANRRSGAGGRTVRVDRQIAELTCRFAVACFCSSIMLLFLIVTCCRSNERKTLGGLVLASLSACSFCHCHTKMRLLELFSGTKLVDGAFEALGWEVGSLLIVPENEPTGRLIPQAERTGASLHVRTQSGEAGEAWQPCRQGVQGGVRAAPGVGEGDVQPVRPTARSDGSAAQNLRGRQKRSGLPLLEHAQELEKFEASQSLSDPAGGFRITATCF